MTPPGMTPPGTLARTLRLTLAAEPAAVRAALLRATGWLRVAGVPADLCDQTQIVLAEVLNNIAEHAYRDCGGPIDLHLRLGPQRLFCAVRDRGDPMPDQRGQAARPPVADLPEGGFGWHLIRSLTSALSYRREGGRNRLRFVIERENG